MPKNRFSENDLLMHWIEDGIMYTSYKVSEIQTLEEAKLGVSSRLEMLEEGEELPYIVDARKLKKIAPEPRKYVGKEGSQGVAFSAIIVESKISTLIANFFLMFVDLHNTPCRLFTDKDKAVKWINKMKSK